MPSKPWGCDIDQSHNLAKAITVEWVSGFFICTAALCELLMPVGVSTGVHFGEKLVEPPLREEFLSWESGSGYMQIDVRILADIMHDHPQMKLVTDVKSDTIEGLKYLAAHIADYKVRVIPQFYQPEVYEETRKLGYQNLIWALYRYNGGTQQVLEEAQNMNLFAISMPRERARGSLPKRLSKLGTPAYAHTINDPMELRAAGGL